MSQLLATVSRGAVAPIAISACKCGDVVRDGDGDHLLVTDEQPTPSMVRTVFLTGPSGTDLHCGTVLDLLATNQVWPVEGAEITIKDPHAPPQS